MQAYQHNGGTYAVVVSAGQGPHLLDISDPANINDPGKSNFGPGAHAREVATYVGDDGEPYFVVTWSDNHALQTFEVHDNGRLDDLSYLFDPSKMNTPGGVIVYSVGSKRYAAVAAAGSSSVRIVDVTDPRALGNGDTAKRDAALKGQITDGGTLELQGALGIAHYPLGNKHYAVVASSGDDGVQVLDITDPDSITAADHLSDTEGANELLLDGATGVAIYSVGGRSYAVVSGRLDNGIQIIDITNPSNITAAGKLQNTSSLRLAAVRDVAIHTIGGRHYAVTVSGTDSAIQLIDVTDPDNPVGKANLVDTSATLLSGARGVDTFTIGNRHYAIVASDGEHAVQIVELVVVQADAGPDQTVSTGATVSLDGSGSVVSSGETASYNWTQTGGTSVTLSNSSAVSPTFTAPSTSRTLTFRLAVTYGGVTSTDTVTITNRAVSGTYTGHGGTVASPSLNVQTVNKVDGGSAQYLSMHFSGEDESRTFSYRLAAQPSSTITVDFMTLVQSEGYGRPGYTWDWQAVSVSPQRLAFTTSNWSTPQTVNIVSQTDEDSRSEQVIIAIVTSIPRAQGDPYGYAGIHVTVDDTQSRRSSPGTEAELGRLKRPEETQAQPEQQVLANNPPTVAAPLADLIEPVVGGGTEVDLSGVFADADGDALAYSASTTNEDISYGFVQSSGLLVVALGRGTVTITVTADDGNGGTVSDSFTVTVKEAPTVASPIADIGSLEAGASQQISLSGVFTDADGDALTYSAASSDTAVATTTVSGGSLTVTAQQAGTATITVTARDTDGNQVSDTFDVTVIAKPEPQVEAPTSSSGSEQEQDVVARYDTNKDGVISLSEYRAAVAALYKDVSLAELVRIRQAWVDGGYKQ